MSSAIIAILVVIISAAIAGRTVLRLYRSRSERSEMLIPDETISTLEPTPHTAQPETPSSEPPNSLMPYILTQDTLTTITAVLEHTDPLYAFYLGQQLLLYVPIHHHQKATDHGLIPYPDIISSLNITEAAPQSPQTLNLTVNNMYLLKIEKNDPDHLKIQYSQVIPHHETNELLINPDKHTYTATTYLKVTNPATQQQRAQQHTHTLPVRKIEETMDTA